MIRTFQKKSFQTVAAGVAAVLFSAGVLSMSPIISRAASGSTQVVGRVYEFEGDAKYEFSNTEEFSLSNEDSRTYGAFSINGNVTDITERDGLEAYGIDGKELSFVYSYSDTLLNAEDEEWHLIDDKSKTINDFTTSQNIMKGAVIVQTSRDGKIWNSVQETTNVFSDKPIETDAFYNVQDVQLINGCYYRVIVVYELGRKTGTSGVLFIQTDDYEYKKYAEVYEFYAYDINSTDNTIDPSTTPTKNLGRKVKTEKEGYTGNLEIGIKDAHYGWEIGQFFVSGYTRETIDASGNPVFLKNVGDQITLWFNLKQNINSLNGNDKLTISEDKDGYDQAFETPKGNFGRGTLIVSFTDHQGITYEPVLYTDYLAANAQVGADTIVQMFEEGDYEVALDYELADKGLVFTDYSNYRISFSFSVRNGNCMVYPFDVVTGEELTNSSLTENGFRLDLARSRYLDINIRKEVLQEGADGLVEDVRFNRPAKDGDEYTDDGIYTITVKNRYTNQETVKRIYVGSNGVLKAYVTTGLTIQEIEDLLSLGATIDEDGNIKMPEPDYGSPESSDENNTDDTSETADDETSNDNQEDVIEDTTAAQSGGTKTIVPVIVACVAAALCGGAVVASKKKKKVKEDLEKGIKLGDGAGNAEETKDDTVDQDENKADVNEEEGVQESTDKEDAQ